MRKKDSLRCPVCETSSRMHSVVSHAEKDSTMDIMNKCKNCGYESHMVARLLRINEIKCEGCLGPLHV